MWLRAAARNALWLLLEVPASQILPLLLRLRGVERHPPTTVLTAEDWACHAVLLRLSLIRVLLAPQDGPQFLFYTLDPERSRRWRAVDVSGLWWGFREAAAYPVHSQWQDGFVLPHGASLNSALGSPFHISLPSLLCYTAGQLLPPSTLRPRKALSPSESSEWSIFHTNTFSLASSDLITSYSKSLCLFSQ